MTVTSFSQTVLPCGGPDGSHSICWVHLPRNATFLRHQQTGCMTPTICIKRTRVWTTQNVQQVCSALSTPFLLPDLNIMILLLNQAAARNPDRRSLGYYRDAYCPGDHGLLGLWIISGLYHHITKAYLATHGNRCRSLQRGLNTRKYRHCVRQWHETQFCTIDGTRSIPRLIL